SSQQQQQQCLTVPRNDPPSTPPPPASGKQLQRQTSETDEERRRREERENAEKNELSLIRMLVKHNRQIGVSHNMNFLKPDQVISGNLPGSGANSILDDEEFFDRDEFRRTASMVSYGPGKVKVMTKHYK